MAEAKRRTFKSFLNATPVAISLYFAVIFGFLWLAYSGAQAMGYNWQWYRMSQYFYRFTEDGFQWGEIMVGLVKTIQLSGTAFIFATVLGLIIALLRLSGLVFGTAVAVVFLEFVRNMPILVLLYLFYYVLGPIFNLDRYTASVMCLAVFHAALISEIFRGGIQSVPKGQWEGATSIGMTKAQAYRYIVLPQSVKFMLPPMTGEIVHMVKSSAIVSVIAVAELTTVGRNLISDTYMSFEIWFTIAIVYLVLTLALSLGITRIEKKFAIKS